MTHLAASPINQSPGTSGGGLAASWAPVAMRGARVLPTRCGNARPEVETVGNIEVAERTTRRVLDTVLPDDLVGGRIDDEHPIAVVVGDADISVGQADRDGRVVKAFAVLPKDMAVPIDTVDDAGRNVIGHQKGPVRLQ